MESFYRKQDHLQQRFCAECGGDSPRNQESLQSMSVCSSVLIRNLDRVGDITKDSH